MERKKLFLLIIAIFTIIFFFIIVSVLNNVKKLTPITPLVTPTPVQIEPKPNKNAIPHISPFPTVPPQQGGGVNTQSPLIINSENEIKKIYPYLPFSKEYTLSTGLVVEIIIPPEKYQPNPWVLSVSISGIDYRISSSDSDYALMKKSFLEASTIVFFWLREHQVDTGKIYISWGEKGYINDIAKQWLSEQ